jgi:hypothetical protein
LFFFVGLESIARPYFEIARSCVFYWWKTFWINIISTVAFVGVGLDADGRDADDDDDGGGGGLGQEHSCWVDRSSVAKMLKMAIDMMNLQFLLLACRLLFKLDLFHRSRCIC